MFKKMMKVTFSPDCRHGYGLKFEPSLIIKTITMATIKLNAPQWAAVTAKQNNKVTLWDKMLVMADSQAPNKTVWFLVSLVLQGVLFLPIPAVLMYYYDAPIVVLAVTMILFFANMIAGMGGSGIRTVLFFFAASVVIHLVMLAVFVI